MESVLYWNWWCHPVLNCDVRLWCKVISKSRVCYIMKWLNLYWVLFFSIFLNYDVLLLISTNVVKRNLKLKFKADKINATFYDIAGVSYCFVQQINNCVCYRCEKKFNVANRQCIANGALLQYANTNPFGLLWHR